MSDTNKTTEVEDKQATVAGKPDAANTTNPEPELAPEADTFLILQQLEEIKAKAAKADEFQEKYMRLLADFDNFKKRSARDAQENARYANQSLLEKLVPVLDNFEAAMAAVNGTQGASVDSLKTGINMIHVQLKNVLTDVGLEEVDASNQPFNPNLHEAVSHQENPDVADGQVLQQLRKGYKLRDRLIRPATVIVAKKPSA